MPQCTKNMFLHAKHKSVDIWPTRVLDSACINSNIRMPSFALFFPRLQACKAAVSFRWWWWLMWRCARRWSESARARSHHNEQEIGAGFPAAASVCGRPEPLCPGWRTAAGCGTVCPTRDCSDRTVTPDSCPCRPGTGWGGSPASLGRRRRSNRSCGRPPP